MENIIILGVEFAIAVGCFILGRYVLPNIPRTVADKLPLLSAWAGNFVEWARDFMKASTGEEKMAAVVAELKKIADEAGLEVTEEQLKAIAQSAYNAMKAGEDKAKAEAEAIALTAEPVAIPVQQAPTINIYTAKEKAAEKPTEAAERPAEGVTAIATDNVPPGALEPTEDGRVKTYDADGNQTGTISAEEAEAAAAAVDNVVVEAADAGTVTVEVETAAEEAEDVK